MGIIIRNPCTTQELREYNEEYGRAKRSKKHLPNSFDDCIIETRNDWKKKRKKRKQWER